MWNVISFEVVAMRIRGTVVDRKIGSIIRVQRLNLGMSQADLGKALGLTLQQIQKYESGRNAVASTRVAALCRILKISPNDLFGVFAKANGDAAPLSLWAAKVALKLEEVSPGLRQVFHALLEAVPKRRCEIDSRHAIRLNRRVSET
jgi:transcriptional regulator with XRE-family HTH domain